jgi:hypothetical protein
MPGSSAFIQIDSIKRPTCNSGQACTHTGYWQAERIAGQSWSYFEKGEPRRLEKGEIMPTQRVQSRHPRFLLSDRITVEEANVEWRLFGEA